MLISLSILPSPGLYLLPAPVFPAAISEPFNLVSSSLVLLKTFFVMKNSPHDGTPQMLEGGLEGRVH